MSASVVRFLRSYEKTVEIGGPQEGPTLEQIVRILMPMAEVSKPNVNSGSAPRLLGWAERHFTAGVNVFAWDFT
jgi:hypothetical protein